MQGVVERSSVALLAVRAVNALGKPFGIVPVARSFPNPISAHAPDRSAAFDHIYRANFWGSKESRSGLGSEAHYAQGFARRLRKCLEEMRLTRIFDAPCGDLNWVLGIARDERISYEGGDISPTLICELQSRFPDVRIRTFDICTARFPDADVWLCRDCLFHLPFADIRKALLNFAGSQIKYALLTTHSARMLRNVDVTAGGFRYLDLERAPISLPPAQVYLKDYRMARDFPRFVGLWSRDAIAEVCARWATPQS